MTVGLRQQATASQAELVETGEDFTKTNQVENMPVNASPKQIKLETRR